MDTDSLTPGSPDPPPTPKGYLGNYLLSGALPGRWRQALKRHSPISPSDRQKIERLFVRLRRRPLTRDTMQGVADTLRPTVERVHQSQAAGYLELGAYLVWLKELHTPHGLFLSLFQDSPNAIDTPLPLSAKKAQALMRAVKNPVIANPKNWRSLPMDEWRNLDDLTRLGPGLQAAIDRGLVHPRMSRPAILALRAGPTAALPAADPLASVRVAVRRYLRDDHPRPPLREFLQDTLAHLDREPEDAAGDDDLVEDPREDRVVE